MLKTSTIACANALLLVLSPLAATGRDFGDDSTYGREPADSRRANAVERERDSDRGHQDSAKAVTDVPPVPEKGQPARPKHFHPTPQVTERPIVPSAPSSEVQACDCGQASHEHGANRDLVYRGGTDHRYGRSRQYGTSGTPLHPIDGQSAGSRFSGSRGYRSGQRGLRAGYVGGGRSRSGSVERWTGVPGMRVSEWPSPSTGLTLSEEQSMGMRRSGGSDRRGFHSGPFSSVGYSVPLAPKLPVINIPDHVW